MVAKFLTKLLVPIGFAMWVCAGQAQVSSQAIPVDLDAEVTQVADHASRFLSQTDLALIAAEEIARSRAVAPIVQHAALRPITDRVSGLRAILSISGDGLLEIDSFTYPAAVLNLAGRSYFRLAVANPGALIITAPEVGKTSGVPFVPIAKGHRDGVLVAVANPGAFLPARLCTRCVSYAVDQSGALLASNPPGAQMIGLRPDVSMDRAAGKANIGSYSARYSMQRAAQYPVWAIIMMVE